MTRQYARPDQRYYTHLLNEHLTDHPVFCNTARPAPRCTCGAYRLVWL